MKQKGYTLAEVLICVGIVGVLAAILLPLANKYRPDSTKALYVKTFNAVTDTVRIVLKPCMLRLLMLLLIPFGQWHQTKCCIRLMTVQPTTVI